MKLKVQPCNDVFIQFSEDDMAELDLQPGDKFSVKKEGDAIILEKFGTLELNLADFDRDTLEVLIKISCEEDKSINEVVADILESVINQSEGKIKDDASDIGKRHRQRTARV
jgi:hypothetical protein